VSSRRYFTLEEANAQLGRLNDLFGQVLLLRAQIKTISTRVDPKHTSERELAILNGLVEAAGEVVEEISGTGCVIKDLAQGLVDWPALHEGREVWLCWRYGESEVSYWHDMHAGFAGRRPVSELESAAASRQLH
jgi:hypothetical protein